MTSKAVRPYYKELYVYVDYCCKERENLLASNPTSIAQPDLQKMKWKYGFAMNKSLAL